jgi:hypothetical protein
MVSVQLVPRDAHSQTRHSYLKTQSGGETSLNWGQRGKSALAAGEGAVNHEWALIGRVEKSQGEKGVAERAGGCDTDITTIPS